MREIPYCVRFSLVELNEIRAYRPIHLLTLHIMFRTVINDQELPHAIKIAIVWPFILTRCREEKAGEKDGCYDSIEIFFDGKHKVYIKDVKIGLKSENESQGIMVLNQQKA